MSTIELPFFSGSLPECTALRDAMNKMYRSDEAECVNALLAFLDFTPDQEHKTAELAGRFIRAVREEESDRGGIESLMMHYDLSTEEGVLLMCLAEALLRIPDKQTEQLLIQDKLTSANWKKHVGASESSFVNLATRGLALSGKVLNPSQGGILGIWKGLLRRSSEPVIRRAVHEVMKLLSEQFVVGRTIKEALKRSKPMMQKGYRYSYDMLGEVARTQKDADEYFDAYYNAITALGEANGDQDLISGSSISVKLSALHPRYEFTKRETIVSVLVQRVKKLASHARDLGLSFTIDAEEADRLDMSLDIIKALFCDPDFKEWNGLGIALQAYQKRAFYLIDWVIDLARQQGKRLQVRLVKGAYWDSEIKLSQVEGFQNYPVFTRKVNTDLSYLACAKKMLSAQDAIYPQFATHNAYSVAAILTLMGGNQSHYQFEFQNLQGMGKTLHNCLVDATKFNLPSRIYAPVGSHEDLLPYLVRRLLENGANSSFVNRISDQKTPIEALTKSPVAVIRALDQIAHSDIPLPKAIYGDARVNSAGLDLSDLFSLQTLAEAMDVASKKTWQAVYAGCKEAQTKEFEYVTDPTNVQRQIGTVIKANREDAEQALLRAHDAFFDWDQRSVQDRAGCLRKAGDLMEAHTGDLIYLAVREAGKTLHDAVAELREAVDFCRYYAKLAEDTLVDQVLPGPTGESNVLRMKGRGPILCISPWNFPIAIFAGQVAAALVCGNPVIAKPADQTPLTAALVVKLFHEAGVPEAVLQLMPGEGSVIGQALIENPLIKGVLFTGSNQTADRIQKTLANRSGPIVPFVAETGGINAMIADSSALPEQLVRDVLLSAFGSAGQRCSALRVLFIQEDIAETVIEMLSGAMAEMEVGDPLLFTTDVGPIIDVKAQQALQDHATTIASKTKLIYKVALPSWAQAGTFIAPQAYELPDLSLLKKEVFGPILHVIRYPRKSLDAVIDSVNALGYGLTFGIQSRIDEQVEYIEKRIQAGNIYVNRNMIGAVVGVQPFGGSGLSGTGPKAGGPHYLARLCQESTLSTDTTAAGGNASLMAIED